jgi:hypothetical protein
VISKGKTALILVMALLFVIGCATERVMTTTSRQLPPTNADEVTIYLANKKPPYPHEAIGRVSVGKRSMVGLSRSGDEIYKNLREKAASIGGDAIINITEDSGSMSGVVVKMTTKKK